MSVPRAMVLSMVVVCLFAAGRILHEGVTLRQADEAGTRILPENDRPGKRLAVVAGILALGCALVVGLHLAQWAQAAALALGGAGLLVAVIVGVGYVRAEQDVPPVYVWAGVLGLLWAAAWLAAHWRLRRRVADGTGLATPTTGHL